MDSEELGGNFVLAVEELGLTGLWTTIKDVRCGIAAYRRRSC